MLVKLACLYLAVICARAAPPVDVVPLEKQQPTVIPIISQSEELEANGTYKFSYETGNGIKREETSYDKVLPKAKSGPSSSEGGEDEDSDEIHVQQGSYSYTAPDGTIISVRYIADENGFRPIGDHLPKAPTVAPVSTGRRAKTLNSEGESAKPTSNDISEPVIAAKAPEAPAAAKAPETPKEPEAPKAPEPSIESKTPELPEPADSSPASASLAVESRLADTSSEALSSPETAPEPTSEKAPESTSEVVSEPTSEAASESTSELASEPSTPGEPQPTTPEVQLSTTPELPVTESASATEAASSTTEQATSVEITSTAAAEQSTSSEASSTPEASSESSTTPVSEPSSEQPSTPSAESATSEPSSEPASTAASSEPATTAASEEISSFEPASASPSEEPSTPSASSAVNADVTTETVTSTTA